MDYIVVKFNFNCKLKFQFEISNCNFNLQLKLNVGEILASLVKRESSFYLAYGLHRCQIQFQLQVEIAIWNFKLQLKFTHVTSRYILNMFFNWMLGKFWQVHLKGKVAFTLNMNLKLNFNCKLKFQFEISNSNFNLQLKLNVGETLASSVKRESGVYLAYGLHCCLIQFQLQIEITIWNLKLQFQFAIEIYTWYIDIY